ncbi:MAG: 2OG-Fe(II) oxygenase [Acidimicrobiales bacterium]
MSELLSAATLARLDDLHQQFVTAAPFRHVVIDGFLDDAWCRRMADAFPEFDEAAATNELGLVGRKAVQEGVVDLGGPYPDVDGFLQQPEFLAAIGRITGIDGLLYDPHYTGGGTHENLSGQSLNPHVDFNYHPIEHWHRRLNLIVYLNDEWEAEWGGGIEFHRDPWADDDEVTTWLPEFNRAVLFETTERSWHGFQEVLPAPDGAARSRRSFAIYLYSHDRPEDETFAPHATHYVQRPLPDHLRAGHTLDEADVYSIHAAVDERTQWIRFLYERELDMAARVERLSRELRERPTRPMGLGTMRRAFRGSDLLQALAPEGTRRRDAVRRVSRNL